MRLYIDLLKARNVPKEQMGFDFSAPPKPAKPKSLVVSK